MRSETDPAKQSYGLTARGKRVDRVRKAHGGARNKSGEPCELPGQSGRRIASGAMPVGDGIAAGADRAIGLVIIRFAQIAYRVGRTYESSR